MDNNMSEFLIDEIINENDISRVRGICNRGPILMNDVFVLTYKSIRNYSETGMTETRVHQAAIRLVVTKIIAYRKSLDELSEGMSGELQLEGDGGSALVERNMLSGEMKG